MSLLLQGTGYSSSAGRPGEPLADRVVRYFGLSPHKKAPKTAPTGMLAEPLIPTVADDAAATGTPVSGGVFVLANTILGAGMLGLPYAFASCGFLVGPLMLLAFGGCSVTALILLSEAADLAGRPANFRSVSEMAVPGAGLYIDVAVAIKCFGVATSYLIVIGDSVPKAIVAFGASGLWLDRRVWTLAALAVAGPLAYMKQITALRHVSKVRVRAVPGVASGRPTAACPPSPIPSARGALVPSGSPPAVPSPRPRSGTHAP